MSKNWLVARGCILEARFLVNKSCSISLSCVQLYSGRVVQWEAVTLHNPPSSGQSIVGVRATMSMPCLGKVMPTWDDTMTKWQKENKELAETTCAIMIPNYCNADKIRSSWDICSSSCCSGWSELTASSMGPRVITTSPPPRPTECTQPTYSHPQDSFSPRGNDLSRSEWLIIYWQANNQPMT